MFRLFCLATFVLAAGASSSVAAAQTFYPVKDGTLADGGTYGPFDGVADAWDWTFNDTGYEGSITLTTDSPPLIEHRLVWEYDLTDVSFEPPVYAELTFTVRGAPIWPFPDVVVNVYSYPADLIESPEDYSAGPAILEGSATVVAYQPPTDYTLDVSSVVSEALLSGENKVAFRFQIAPDTPNESNQAFVDALDADPATKPSLTIDAEPELVGDLDGDGDVDLADLAILLGAYGACTGDANYNADADLDSSGCVDLADLAVLLSHYGDSL